MNIYEYVPQKNFKKLSGLVTVLICAALALFLVSSLFPEMPYRWILQLLGMVCLAAVIYISVRHVGRAFVYRIVQNEDGSRDLTVTEVTNGGKSRITVCRIDLSGIEEVAVLDRKSDTDRLRIKQIKRRVGKLFVYHPDINASNACYILATECGERLTIKLAVDGTLVDYLKRDIDSRSAQ